jgi:hypothetical protein
MLLAILSAGHCRTIESMIGAAEKLRPLGKFTLEQLLEKVAEDEQMKLQLSSEAMAIAILEPEISLDTHRHYSFVKIVAQDTAIALESAIAGGQLFATVDKYEQLYITIPPLAFRWSVERLEEFDPIFTELGVLAAKELLQLTTFVGNNFNSSTNPGKIYEATHRLVEQLIECLRRGLYKKTAMAITGTAPNLYREVTAQRGLLAATPYQLTAPRAMKEVFRPNGHQQFPHPDFMPALREHLSLPESTDSTTLSHALSEYNCRVVPAWESQQGYDYLRVVLDKKGNPFVILTESTFTYGGMYEKGKGEEALIKQIIQKPQLGVKLPWELLGLDRATQVLHVHVIYGTHNLTKDDIKKSLRESGVGNAMVVTGPDLEKAYRGLTNLIPFLVHRRALEVAMPEEVHREALEQFREEEAAESAEFEAVIKSSQGDW